jgi:hypothetical protein
MADAEEVAFGGVNLGTRNLLDAQNFVRRMKHCVVEVISQEESSLYSKLDSAPNGTRRYNCKSFVSNAKKRDA